jgi:hypothetical protein
MLSARRSLRGQRHVGITPGRAGSATLASVADATLDDVRRVLAIISHVGLSMSYLSATRHAHSHGPLYQWVARPSHVRVWFKSNPRSHVHGRLVATFTVRGIRCLVRCF